MTAAVALALGTDPMPASLENMPRFTPVMMMIPRVAPATCVVPHASVKIDAVAAGRCSAFMPTMMMPIMRYANATTGIAVCDTLAIRWMPPKMTRAVRVATPAPMTNGSQPAAESSATATMVVASVLACRELNANGKQRMSMTEKTTAALREPSPRSM